MSLWLTMRVSVCWCDLIFMRLQCISFSLKIRLLNCNNWHSDIGRRQKERRAIEPMCSVDSCGQVRWNSLFTYFKLLCLGTLRHTHIWIRTMIGRCRLQAKVLRWYGNTLKYTGTVAADYCFYFTYTLYIVYILMLVVKLLVGLLTKHLWFGFIQCWAYKKASLYELKPGTSNVFEMHC